MDNGEAIKPGYDIETSRLSTVEAGVYKPEDIVFVKATDNRPTSPELEAEIERVWTREKADNPKLFNRPKFDIRDIRRREDGKLELVYGLTDYKTFVGTRDPEVENRYPESVPRVLSVAAVIETPDGDLVMQQRENNDNVLHYRGWVAGPGGNVEAPYQDNPGNTNENGDPDPVSALLEEIEQESGIKPEHISDIVCNGLVKNGKRGFGALSFRARTDLSKDEIEELKGTHEEGRTIITEPDLKEFHKLLGYNQIILQDVLPTLLYVGRDKFGSDWYNRMIEKLKRSHNYASLTSLILPEETEKRVNTLIQNATKRL